MKIAALIATISVSSIIAPVLLYYYLKKNGNYNQE
jgi:hypothetical protein